MLAPDQERACGPELAPRLLFAQRSGGPSAQRRLITLAQRCDYACRVSQDPDEQAVLAEERSLQAAQLAGDADELDRLLHPELLAVGPDGQMVDKAADLAAHRAGVFEIFELEEEEVRVKVVGDVAMTFVVLRVRGTIDDAEVGGRMRYTRTWTRDGGPWRVVAAHISPAA